MPVDCGKIVDETKKNSFTVKPFKNRNGAISCRVSGWLLGGRIRKNFKAREDAILERGTLQLKQAQASSDLLVTSTFLGESQLREAVAAFLKLKEHSRSLTFYLDIGLETHREPKANHPLADAISAYLTQRAGDAAQKTICQRQLNAIRIELALFQKHFPDRTVGELATGQLLDYISRENAALRTQNNRRAPVHVFQVFVRPRLAWKQPAGRHHAPPR